MILLYKKLKKLFIFYFNLLLTIFECQKFIFKPLKPDTNLKYKNFFNTFNTMITFKNLNKALDYKIIN